MELGLSLLLYSKAPNYLWTKAFHIVVFVINRLPTIVNPNKKSPFEMFIGYTLDYSILKSFGCICDVHIPKGMRGNLAPKSEKCLFIGYSDQHKGYRCYSPTRRKIWYPSMLPLMNTGISHALKMKI